MKIIKKVLLVVVGVVVMFMFTLTRTADVYAATSPTLSALSGYSVLGGAAVTCTGLTTLTGAVGVSPGTSFGAFPVPCTAAGGTHSNDASAIAAQAEATSTFTALNQTCDQTFGAVDLTATFPTGVGPGVYCSTSSFTLTGNLNLTGSGVWIFKTASTLITSPGSSVTGGDPCNVWWRVGSSATLGTTTAFLGNVLALNGANAMNTGASLNGRWITLAAGTATLDTNTITGPTCALAPTPTPSSSSSSSSPSSSSGPGSPAVCTSAGVTFVPTITGSRRVSPTSIFLSWGISGGLDDFIVQYGFQNGNWPFSTNVSGFSTTINNLPANQPVWVRVAATDNCLVGAYGTPILIGSRAGSPGFPNTGSPKLPNAGVDPE